MQDQETFRLMVTAALFLVAGVLLAVTFMGQNLRQSVESGKICFEIEEIAWHKCFYLIQEDQISSVKEVISLPKEESR